VPQLDIFVLYGQVFTTSLFFILSYILLTKRYLARIASTLKFRFWKTWVTHRHCSVISQFYRLSRRGYHWRSMVFSHKLFKRLKKIDNEVTFKTFSEFLYTRIRYVNSIFNISNFLKKRVILESSRINL